MDRDTGERVFSSFRALSDLWPLFCFQLVEAGAVVARQQIFEDTITCGESGIANLIITV